MSTQVRIEYTYPVADARAQQFINEHGINLLVVNGCLANAWYDAELLDENDPLHTELQRIVTGMLN